VNALKELCRIGWSKWYFKMAMGSLIVGILLMVGAAYRDSLFNGALGVLMVGIPPTLPESHGPAAVEKYHLLCTLLNIDWALKAIQTVGLVAVVVGFAGHSLDTGYNWLRKRRAGQQDQVQ
jgi:hypothetical protein